MTCGFPPKGHLQYCLTENKVSFYKFKDEIMAWLMTTNFGEIILEVGEFAPKVAGNLLKPSKKKEMAPTPSSSSCKEIENQDIHADIDTEKLEKYKMLKANLAAHMKEFVGITLWTTFLRNAEFKERLQYEPANIWKFIKHYYTYDLSEARKGIYEAITGYKRNGKGYTEFAKDLHELYKIATQLEEPNSRVPDGFIIPIYFQLLDENIPLERIIKQQYIFDYLADKKYEYVSSIYLIGISL